MSSDAQRLAALCARLGPAARRSLLDYAEFLAAREPAAPAPPSEPLAITRVAGESVVAALRRLRRTYPMLDSTRLLDSAATGMTRHVLHGHAADEVIDGLETLFAEAYAAHRAREDGQP
jgi:hypothetical protein